MSIKLENPVQSNQMNLLSARAITVIFHLLAGSQLSLSVEVNLKPMKAYDTVSVSMCSHPNRNINFLCCLKKLLVNLGSALGLSLGDNVDNIWDHMWPHLNCFTLDNDEYTEWYMMDEVGIAINHSDNPNFR